MPVGLGCHPRRRRDLPPARPRRGRTNRAPCRHDRPSWRWRIHGLRNIHPRHWSIRRPRRRAIVRSRRRVHPHGSQRQQGRAATTGEARPAAAETAAPRNAQAGHDFAASRQVTHYGSTRHWRRSRRLLRPPTLSHCPIGLELQGAANRSVACSAQLRLPCSPTTGQDRVTRSRAGWIPVSWNGRIQALSGSDAANFACTPRQRAPDAASRHERALRHLLVCSCDGHAICSPGSMCFN